MGIIGTIERITVITRLVRVIHFCGIWIARTSRVMTVLFVFTLFHSPAHADCADPVEVAGEIIYNGDEHMMQYCDATDTWIAMGQDHYAANAVHFDGANDWLLGRPGSGSGTKATISFWFRNNNPSSHQQIIGDNGHDNITLNYVPIYDSFVIRFGDNAGSNHLDIRVNTDVDDADWHHVLISFDLTDTNKRHVYIDGVLDSTSWNTYNTGGTLDFATTEDITFSRRAPNNNARHVNGDMADFWMDFGTYIDLSIASNREKFIDADGKPVDLGSDGSRPTGSAPEMFLSGDTDSWHTNDGIGGGFTKNGALTDAESTPSIPPGPLNGLVGWWKLDETGATTTAVDSSGNGNDGTMGGGLSGNNSASGVISNALHFENGANSRINIGASNALLTAASPWTASVWFNASSIDSASLGDRMLLFRRDASGNSAFIMGVGNSDKLIFWFFNGGASTREVATISPGRWYHYAVTYDGTDFIMYLNGAQVDSVTSGFSGFGADPAAISIDGNTFDGLIDDVRVYNTDLDATEIEEVYNYGRVCQNPDGFRGEMTYNASYHIMQFCNDFGWQGMSEQAGDGSGDPCAPGASPTAGTLCADGSYYVGITPDGSGEPFYIMPSNVTGYAWNDGNSNNTETFVTDYDTGEANTDALMALDSDSVAAGIQPHQQATYCHNLAPPDMDALGHSDWYLPAFNEMLMVYDDMVDEDGDDDPDTPTPGIDYGLVAGDYSNSTERQIGTVRVTRFSNGGAEGSTLKDRDNRVFRCARKGYVPPADCSNPSGRAGEIIYNSGDDVMQYCEGDEWIAIGKTN